MSSSPRSEVIRPSCNYTALLFPTGDCLVESSSKGANERNKKFEYEDELEDEDDYRARGRSVDLRDRMDRLTVMLSRSKPTCYL